MILYPVEIDWMLWIFLLEKSWPPVTVPKPQFFDAAETHAAGNNLPFPSHNKLISRMCSVASA